VPPRVWANGCCMLRSLVRVGGWGLPLAEDGYSRKANGACLKELELVKCS
jgi:hypothetical protein